MTLAGMVVLFTLIAASLILLVALEWVRRCPICHAVMRQQFGDRGPWVCPRCGWTA